MKAQLMKHYVITRVLHQSQEDSPTEGLIGAPLAGGSFPLHLSALSPDMLLRKLCAHFSIPPEEMDFGTEAEDALGKISFTRLETAAGYQASEADITRWKAGHQKLYSTDYLTRSYECTPVSIAPQGK